MNPITPDTNPAVASQSTRSGWLRWFSLRQQGLLRFAMVVVGIIVVFLFLLSLYWGMEPDLFDVQAAAEERAKARNETLVVGYITTNTLIQISNTLLNKPGGYLSNDKMPPGIFMDNIPNWEFGVLRQVRDFTKVLRNDISRSQTLGDESKDLANAEPRFNVDNMAWMFPAAESEYAQGIAGVEAYLNMLADPSRQDAQFFSRADNLTDWLRTVSRRLGDLSQRLSASVGQARLNIDLAGDPDARRATGQEAVDHTKTPWLEIDDVFYETRGTTWALLHLLHAIDIDFKEVLEKKNARVSLQQIIRELESTQRTVWSPMILNGSDFGFFANHSLVMAGYISRANAGIIELRELLQRG
ncbi:hypothetical protein TPSD3_09670 [Thioflexithrix psekupsensis]|uniref:DUF2333 domain-containing protein n=2 Tax=Thioflexithrix psekupsensis TaxID=1570016 RepID=A0A251X9S2_9GAMM|nr:hypothetical protein TPSD3_09670 [Thioflexithrix psekupsensis]